MINREVPFVLVPYKPFAGYDGAPYYFLLDNVRDIQPTSDLSCTVYMVDGTKIHADGNADAMHNAISDARAAALNPIISDRVPFRTAIDAYNHLMADLREANQALLDAMGRQPEGFGSDEYANTLVYWRAAVCIRRLANDAELYRVILSEIPAVQQVHPLLLGRQHEVAMQFIIDAVNTAKAVQDMWHGLFLLRGSEMPEEYREQVCALMSRNEHLVPKHLQSMLQAVKKGE